MTAVGPPVTQAYPLNEGWHLPNQSPRKPSTDTYGDDLRRLTDLTIHELTLYLTKTITDGVRPNCERAWETRLALPYPIPWRMIWASIGTPLSDPTEEKAWRKLLHRAINARNRHPTNPDKSCRLKCGCNDESMLHLIECRHARPLWSACAKFIRDVLGEPTHFDLRLLIIFNLANRDEVVSVQARAFLRHVFQAYYRDLTNVDLHKSIFRWQLTFNAGMRSFRDAVLRWGHSHVLLYTSRQYTNLTPAATENDRQRFGNLIEVSGLSTEFQTAIDSAASDAANRLQHDSRPRRP